MKLRHWVESLDNNNAQGEFYLTDIVVRAVNDGVSVRGFAAANVEEVMGINDKRQLAMAERALQRRLALDFSDTFREGFAFDNIQGAFLLDGGSAYTSDSSLEGPAARIDIMGRTDVGERRYDQYVTVTRRVSSTIPVAAALAGGPGVGAAVLLARMSVRNPSVTGPRRSSPVRSIRFRMTGRLASLRFVLFMKEAPVR